MNIFLLSFNRSRWSRGAENSRPGKFYHNLSVVPFCRGGLLFNPLFESYTYHNHYLATKPRHTKCFATFVVAVGWFFKNFKIFQNLSTFAMKVSKALNLVDGRWKSSPKPIISNTVMFVKCSQSDFSLQRALCRFIWDWGASKSKLRFGWKWSCVQKRGAL